MKIKVLKHNSSLVILDEILLYLQWPLWYCKVVKTFLAKKYYSMCNCASKCPSSNQLWFYIFSSFCNCADNSPW